MIATTPSLDTSATPATAAAPAGGDPVPHGLLDAVVIGGGAAGLSGALMLARSRRSVAVIDSGSPRNAPADAVHGLLGNEGTPPVEFLARGRDELPEVPGLARHWGRGVVHCPYCHGWEVRDEPIGIIATRPASLHQAFMFRQLSDDIIVFAQGLGLDAETRERCDARGIRVVETAIEEVVAATAGGITGVRLVTGEVVARTTLVVATVMAPRTEGLEGLGLTLEDVPGGMGRKIAGSFAGTTDVPGVWVAGNAADPSAQVGASAAGGALAGGHLNGMLVMADADAAVAARRSLSAVRR